MGLKRIVTRNGIVIEDTTRTATISLRDGANRERTEAQLNTELSRQLPDMTTQVFIHKNRNGTVAVATGVEPEIWPENQR